MRYLNHCKMLTFSVVIVFQAMFGRIMPKDSSFVEDVVWYLLINYLSIKVLTGSYIQNPMYQSINLHAELLLILSMMYMCLRCLDRQRKLISQWVKRIRAKYEELEEILRPLRESERESGSAPSSQGRLQSLNEKTRTVLALISADIIGTSGTASGQTAAQIFLNHIFWPSVCACIFVLLYLPLVDSLACTHTP